MGFASPETFNPIIMQNKTWPPKLHMTTTRTFLAIHHDPSDALKIQNINISQEESNTIKVGGNNCF